MGEGKLRKPPVAEGLGFFTVAVSKEGSDSFFQDSFRTVFQVM